MNNFLKNIIIYHLLNFKNLSYFLIFKTYQLLMKKKLQNQNFNFHFLKF